MKVYEHKNLAKAIELSGAADKYDVKFMSRENGVWRVWV